MVVGHSTPESSIFRWSNFRFATPNFLRPSAVNIQASETAENFGKFRGLGKAIDAPIPDQAEKKRCQPKKGKAHFAFHLKCLAVAYIAQGALAVSTTFVSVPIWSCPFLS